RIEDVFAPAENALRTVRGRACGWSASRGAVSILRFGGPLLTFLGGIDRLEETPFLYLIHELFQVLLGERFAKAPLERGTNQFRGLLAIQHAKQEVLLFAKMEKVARARVLDNVSTIVTQRIHHQIHTPGRRNRCQGGHGIGSPNY